MYDVRTVLGPKTKSLTQLFELVLIRLLCRERWESRIKNPEAVAMEKISHLVSLAIHQTTSLPVIRLPQSLFEHGGQVDLKTK